jgi:integrase
MAKQNLTKASIESLAYSPEGPSRQIVWDAKLRGFGCRVTPEGGKSYVILYRASGRQRLMSLGPVQDFKSLDQARAKAEMLLHGLRHEHIDPMAARDRMADVERVSSLWSVYERDHLKGKSPNTLRAVSSAWRNHLEPVVGALKPGQVTTADVIRVHDLATKKGGPVIANRAVQRLRAMLTWLNDRHEQQFPADWRNPAVKFAKSKGMHRENPRTEILDPTQQRALVTALADEPDPWVRVYLQLLMLTGARAGEIASLKWQDVDLEKATAVLRGRKNGRDLLMPLHAGAVKLLRALPVVEGNPFVFASPRTNGPLTTNSIRSKYNAALERAGIPHRTLHDLRRSVGTNLARAGVSTKLIAEMLGNTAEVTATVYVQIASDDLRRLADLNAQNLLLKQS